MKKGALGRGAREVLRAVTTAAPVVTWTAGGVAAGFGLTRQFWPLLLVAAILFGAGMAVARHNPHDRPFE